MLGQIEIGKAADDLPIREELLNQPEADSKGVACYSFGTILPGFLRLYLPILLIFALLVYALIEADQVHQRDLRRLSIENRVDQVSSEIQLTFRNVVDDLYQLAESAAVRRYIDGNETIVQDLGSDLLNFVRQKGIYDQVRILDRDGKERLRINFNAGEPLQVGKKALQNKRGRYYFDKTLKLSRGQVYVSPMDLNIEQGEVERPFKPMIRFGMPLFASDGSVRGVLLFNYLADNLLRSIKNAVSGQEFVIHLLDPMGYWLIAPDTKDEWGFMFPEQSNVRFSLRYPDAWPQISENPSGQILTEQAEFIHASVFPLASAAEANGITTLLPSTRFGPPGRVGNYHWKLVVSAPSADPLITLDHPLVWLFVLLALLGITAGSWFRARIVCHQRAMMGELRLSRDRLERQVAERTEALRSSHEQLHLLLSSTGEGLFGMDQQGQCTFCNQACLEILGYQREEQLLGRNMHDLIHHSHSDGRPYSQDDCPICIASRQGQGVYRDDDVLWRADGSAFPAEYRSRPIISDGVSVGTVVTFNEISERKRVEQERRESEKKLEAILDNAPIGIWMVDVDGRYQFVNRTFCDAVGVEEQRFITTRDLTELLGEDAGRRCQESDRLCLAEESPHQSHERLQFVDGKIHELDVTKTRLVNSDGDVTGAIGIAIDVTERVQAEEKIRTLSQVVEQSPVSVVITDTDANIEYVNSAFERVSGYSASEVLGSNTRILKSGLTPQRRYQELWQAITSGKAWSGEFQNRKKSGDLFWEHAHIAPVLDGEGNTRHYLAVKEDITLQKQQEERILHQAHFDSLTELPNRFLALDRLAQKIKEAHRNEKQVGLLFLDLDDFKKVNDTLGHETGDKLLIQAAKRLRESVREGDTVGRLGGDEFVVLLSGIESAADAQPAAESLLSRFRDPFIMDGRELILTASVGIAIYPDDGDNPAELLRNADTAMYHSKEQGRNTYHYFTDTMNQGVSRRLLLEEQLHGALSRDEFHICYQPLVAIQDRTLVGAEALLRWHNPALGQVSPSEFIPVAEQTGLIVPIGRFVLDQSIRMAAQWQQQCRNGFKIAVNLSPNQFRDPNLIDFIHRTLDRYGTPPETLDLEITEGVLMKGQVQVEQVVEELNGLGANIAMDDFGTGYSSLSYLRIYPFDILKIDRSFIRDITVDSADRELVNAIIAMARGLGLKVVAEGVETEAQLDYLVEKGCDIAQGYLFSEPLVEDAMSELLLSESVF